MHLAAHTFGFTWHMDAEAAFENIAAAGFKQVQLMAAPPHFDPWRIDPARAKRLRAILERNGMTLLAIDLASSDINLASASPNVIAFAVDAYSRTIAHCADLGAKWVCIGSGRRHALLARANTELMESFRSAFNAIVEEAGRRGIGVILENHPQGLLADAETIDQFLHKEGYNQVPVIYDVANAFAIGENPVQGLRVLAKRLGLVHLSDSPSTQWRHDPIGSGDIDFAKIHQCLVDLRYTGTAVLEILSDKPMHDLLDGAKRLATSRWAFDEF